jgi:hypothetical protein
MEFLRLILLSERAMILQHGDDRNVILNGCNVVEFELDNARLDLAAGTPYENTLHPAANQISGR